MGLLTEISLFSGAGGLDLSGRLTGGFRTVCYVEYEPYAQAVLQTRIRAEDLDDAPIWDDVRTFDGKPWRGKVDCIIGGFPCQDLSVAGRREGLGGGRSGLWSQYARIIGEVGPRFVLVENVPGLLVHGALGTVLGQLAEMGYDAEWRVISAADLGAPHLRERVWILAYPIGLGLEGPGTSYRNGRVVGKTGRKEAWRSRHTDDLQRWVEGQLARPSFGGYGEPVLSRVVDGVAFAMDRLRCAGNGVVPDQAIPARQAILKMAGMA